MKRNLVALAVAGAALAPVAALADGSGVVLTGVVHGSVDFFEAEDEGGGKPYKRQASIGNNATRWQIDGTEDLGWSKAIFSLAFDQPFAGCGRISDQCVGRNLGAFNGNGNNTNELSNRNSYLGLTGGWGTLKIGQNEHQYEIQPILQDPDPASEAPFNALTMRTRYGIGGRLDPTTGAVNGTTLAGGNNGLTRRSPGSIWYTSPDFGGVIIDAAYVTPNGRKTNPATGSSLSPGGAELAVQWKAPFGLSLYGSVAQYNDDSGFDNKNRGFQFGVGYGMELFQVDVAFERMKFTSNQAGGIATGLGVIGGTDFSFLDEIERTHIYVAGSLNFGQHHIRAAYTQSLEADSNLGEIENSEARNIFLAYAYTLSKRTELQVIVGETDNKANASYNTGVAGRDLNGLSLGVRHSF